MNSLRFISEAIQSLTANKLRTALTMLGIVIGVAAVISMLSIGQGASSSITSSIESMGTNLIYVSKNNDAANPKALTWADAEAIKQSGSAPSVLAVAPSIQRSLEVIYGGKNISTTIQGVTPEYFSVRNEEIDIGRSITQNDIDEFAMVVVIGKDVVTELFGSSQGVLGQKIRIGNNLYQVIGILKSKGGTSFGSSDNQVFVPMSTAQSRIISKSGVHHEVSMISIAAINADSINSAIHEVTSILRARHGIASSSEDDFSIFSQESFTEVATQVTGILTIFLGGIAGISLLVGGIGIMNIMLVSVVERTKEIGLRKAVGARDSDILFQFLVESLIIGVVGGLLGILLGWSISSIIGQIAAMNDAGFSTDISFSAVILSLVFSISVGLVFGLYPANRAAKLEPVEALRSE